MTNNGEALLSAALAGLGIILQPEILVRDAIRDKRLVPILPGFVAPPRPMHLLYAPDRRMTPKKRTFIEFAVKLFSAGSAGSVVERSS
jgi:DNA-binding transcriptional LysR family regulator